MGTAVTRTIGGLFNGVSQQSSVLRLDGQCEAQENFTATVSMGLEKRSGLNHLKELADSNADKGSYVEFFEDTEGNRYIFIFTGHATEPLEIYTADGTKCTVNFEGNSLDYIASLPSEAYKTLRATTIADYTLVVNNTVECAMGAETSDSMTPYALAWVKRGVISTKYALQGVSNTTTTTTSTTVTDTDVIASALTGLTGYTVTRNGSVLRIEGSQANIDALKARDGYGNQGILLIKGKATKVTDLPPWAQDGDIVEITGKAEDSFANYWLKYNEAENQWQECLAPDLAINLDADTLPQQLIRTDTTEFLFRPANIDEANEYAGWQERQVGDEDSAPEPSFVGNKIQDIFFYKGRLGVVSGNNTILSQANDFFNFFPNTATEVGDSDPFDTSAGSNEVVRLKHAIPHDGDLLLLSDQEQFVLSSGAEIFSPTSAIIDKTTTYPVNPDCAPIALGSDIYFASNAEGFSSIRQYFVQPDSLVKDAVDLTSHASRYIPKDLKLMTMIPNYNATYMYSPEEPQSLYVYKWYTVGNEKPQSAWYKLTLDVDEIVSMGVYDEVLYVLTKKDGKVSIETLNPRDTNTWKLDRYHENSSATWDGAKTTFTLPYTDTALADSWVVVGLKNDGSYEHGAVVTKESDTSISINDDYTTADFVQIFIGKKYVSTYQFSEWFVKDNDIKSFSTGSNVGNIQGTLTLASLVVSYYETGYYRLEITDEGGTVTIDENTGNELGTIVIGQPPINTGRLRTTINDRSDKVTIKLINDSYLPLTVNAVAFEGDWDFNFI